MMKTPNYKTLRKMSHRMLLANKMRHSIAIFAIVLTTLLFTSIFSITGTLIHSYEQETFRSVGGDFHGTYKNVTIDQVERLTQSESIRSYGLRTIVGMPVEAPFNKSHVEVSYMDEICAKGHFAYPEVGKLPDDRGNEIALDTRILSLLGVEPKIGEKIELTYELGIGENKQIIKDYFILSGYWTYDTATKASHALVSKEYATKKLENYVPESDFDHTGSWTLNVYFSNAKNIEKNMLEVINESGLKPEDISTGVNWAYLDAQLNNSMDIELILTLAIFTFMIGGTGYLIIYNIFQMAVSGDVKFYGLLRTIGTTSKQIRKIVKWQGLMLTLIALPLGLLIGYFSGVILSRKIIETLNFNTAYISKSPMIFLISSAFSALTVWISILKPSKTAAKISPIEAVRFSDVQAGKKIEKSTSSKAPMLKMALGSLGRNKRKTALVIASLTLSLVLLQVTATLSRGFDVEKFLDKLVVTDFILGDSNYFQVISMDKSTNPLSDNDISTVNETGYIKESGSVYSNTQVQQFVSPQWFKKRYGAYNSEEIVNHLIKESEKNTNGHIADRAYLYGLDDFTASKLTILEGDIKNINSLSSNGIVAIYETDDYGHVIPDSNYAKIGDEVTLKYIHEWSYIDVRTGKEGSQESIPREWQKIEPKRFDYVTYEVVATASINYAMSLRYFGTEAFALSSEKLLQTAPESQRLIYLFDTWPEKTEIMEQLLQKYTSEDSVNLDFESKKSQVESFDTFKNVFTLLGLLLSSIIGFIGIMNFFNAIYNGIITRKVELAMLESIGMTKKQIHRMLMLEGLLYVLGTAIFSLAISLGLSLYFQNLGTSIFWFFTYKATYMPLFIVLPLYAILGILIPYVHQKSVMKHSVVVRLREATI